MGPAPLTQISDFTLMDVVVRVAVEAGVSLVPIYVKVPRPQP